MITRDELIAKTRRNLVFRGILTLLPILLLIILNVVKNIEGVVIYKSIVAMRYAIFVALEGYLGVKIYRYIKILNDADYCDLVLAQRNDERVTFIRLKTNALVVKVLVYGIGVGIIVAGFVNAYIFFTLLGVDIAIIIIYAGSYLYYNRKF